MKLINTAAGILGARFLGRLFYVRLHITCRCNYHCRMCGIHRRGEKFKELSLPAITQVGQRLAKLGARHVVITGGEPFLRPDLPDVVASLAKQGFSVRIQTNGGPQVTPDLLAACSRAGLRDLSVSIDTLDETLQDSISGARNTVTNSLRTLKLARELLPKGITQANVVASRYNFEELPALIRFFWELGVYTYVTPVMIAQNTDGVSCDYNFRGADTSFTLQDLDERICDRIVAQLVALRRAGMGLTNSTRFLEDWRRKLTNQDSVWRCQAGLLSLDILPDGGVCFCKEKEPIANILDQDFLSFYRSREFRSQAKDAANECEGCFYGEYREPYYAVRELSVLGEWVRNWCLTFRHGMRFSSRP